jgi:hypothetical protein
VPAGVELRNFRSLGTTGSSACAVHAADLGRGRAVRVR